MRARYVSFVLGADRYCVPVDQVMQIVRPEGILAVPTAPPFVTGVISLRGEVIPIVNLKQRFGIHEAPNTPAISVHGASRARIIVIRAGNRSCGLSVDEVREIVDIDELTEPGGGPEELAGRRQFVRGVAHRDGVLFLVLDTQRALSASRDLPAARTV
jgi:purine-binding chemotaxis protein CheW